MVVFADRVDAGRQLAARLGHLRADDVVVVGLPHGGVPVAAEVARALDAPLDVIVVRKLGVPFQPELAMGAIGEGGACVFDVDVLTHAGVSEDDIARVMERERGELAVRVARLRQGRARLDLAGRVAVVVDDGVATGSTARVACSVARQLGAAKVIVAVPVGRGADAARPEGGRRGGLRGVPAALRRGRPPLPRLLPHERRRGRRGARRGGPSDPRDGPVIPDRGEGPWCPPPRPARVDATP